MAEQTKKVKRYISDKYKILDNSLKKIILKNARLMIDYDGECCTRKFNINCAECPNRLAVESGISEVDCSYIQCVSLSQTILRANRVVAKG